MELEDLKSTWKTITPPIEIISERDDELYTNKKRDVRSKLLWRIGGMAMFTFLCSLVMATSPLWCPLHFPISWTITVSCLIFLCAVSEVYMTLMVRKVNLWRDSHWEIMNKTIRIKRYYQNLEFWFTLFMVAMMVWITCVPPIVGTWLAKFGWILMAASLVIEYFWYKKNINCLNTLQECTVEDS